MHHRHLRTFLRQLSFHTHFFFEKKKRAREGGRKEGCQNVSKITEVSYHCNGLNTYDNNESGKRKRRRESEMK